MSNQRSFKIGSFRFVAFVPKKIEYNSFFKQNSGSKQNIFNQFYKILVQKLSFWFVSKFVWENKKFCFVFKKHWHNLKCFGFVLITFFKNTNVLFWFLSSLRQTKTFQTGKKIWILFTKVPFCLLWSLSVWKRFDLIIN